jgi:hypothetical protein
MTLELWVNYLFIFYRIDYWMKDEFVFIERNVQLKSIKKRVSLLGKSE